MIYSQMIRNCKTLKIPLPDLLLNFSHLLSDYLLLTCRLFNQQFSVKYSEILQSLGLPSTTLRTGSSE